MSEKKLIYLASPYSHADEAVRVQRFNAVSRCAAWVLLHTDHFVFAPISHSHPIWENMPKDDPEAFKWEFWAALDKMYVSKSDEIWVLTLPGYEKSTGVKAELAIARELNIPIYFVSTVASDNFAEQYSVHHYDMFLQPGDNGENPGGF